MKSLARYSEFKARMRERATRWTGECCVRARMGRRHARWTTEVYPGHGAMVEASSGHGAADKRQLARSDQGATDKAASELGWRGQGVSGLWWRGRNDVTAWEVSETSRNGANHLRGTGADVTTRAPFLLVPVL